MEKSGKFIVLEGGEGAGKGVVIADLHQRLVGRDDVIFTREPGGTTISEKIRLVLLSKDNSAMLPLTELFCFAALGLSMWRKKSDWRWKKAAS